ncbi:uncharacterized protein LOC112085384 [Eutrema salsugineum]|uniref:uncharacterized protein LOC112085384 n=1 Tax=Eutrema salsugineum TaxID=72664 RepID=UPI000CED2E45|nr:uncharacterized protein LOC112085384 [Eutrema salsugineum]
MDELAAISLAGEEPVGFGGGSDEESHAANDEELHNFAVDDSAEGNSVVVRKKRNGKAVLETDEEGLTQREKGESSRSASIDSALKDVRYEGDGVFVGRIFRNKVCRRPKMTGSYRDSVNHATGVPDGNFQIFPIAYAVVDSENDAAYEWFFRCLQTIIKDDRGVMFISDRHSSIYSRLRKVYPSAVHGACLVHLARNVTTRFKESRLPALMVLAAKAYTVFEFGQLFGELRSVNPACAEYLTELGLPHWTRAYSVGQRYNVMTTNVAESLNKMSLMGWFVRRRAKHAAEIHPLTSKVRDIMDENFFECTKLKVIVVNQNEFEVYDPSGVRFEVNLQSKICSCRQFQMLLIPCCHALAASSYGQIDNNILVGEVYTTGFMRSLYEGVFHPVPTPVSTGEPELLPPIMRRPPGRPRKTRIPSRGEFKRRSKKKAVRLCTRCLGRGHNRASCKLPAKDK